MDSVFFLKLALGFVAGSFAVTLTTVIAEKFGSKIGGLIGGTPSTTVVALLFIGIVHSPETAVQATDVIPFVMGYNCLFLVVFVLLSRYGLLAGLGGAFVLWAVFSLATVAIDFCHFGLGLVIFLFFLVFSYFIMEKVFSLPSVSGVRVRFTPLQIAARALFSRLLIGAVIILSKVSGPLIGGMFAVFPALFTSTIVITSISQGVAFTRALIKPLLVSALINVMIYVTAVRYFYPGLGLVLGTIAAFAVAGIGIFASYSFIKKKMT